MTLSQPRKRRTQANEESATTSLTMLVMIQNMLVSVPTNALFYQLTRDIC